MDAAEPSEAGISGAMDAGAAGPVGITDAQITVFGEITDAQIIIPVETGHGQMVQISPMCRITPENRAYR